MIIYLNWMKKKFQFYFYFSKQILKAKLLMAIKTKNFGFV